MEEQEKKTIGQENNGQSQDQKEKSRFATIFSFAVNLIGIAAGIAGIAAFFLGHPTITCICAAATIVNSLTQCVFGEQKNLITEIITIVIGIVVAKVQGGDLLNYISVALCIGELAMLAFGWLMMLATFLLSARLKSVIMVVLVLSLIASVGINIFQYTKAISVSEQIASSNAEEYEHDANFFYQNIAIVLGDGTTQYHSYRCPYLQQRLGTYSFWAYNTEMAETKGYSACPLCKDNFS